MNAVSVCYCPSQIWGCSFYHAYAQQPWWKTYCKGSIHPQGIKELVLYCRSPYLISYRSLKVLLKFPMDAGFLCDTTTILRDIINWMFCIWSSHFQSMYSLSLSSLLHFGLQSSDKTWTYTLFTVLTPGPNLLVVSNNISWFQNMIFMFSCNKLSRQIRITCVPINSSPSQFYWT